jgi:hypothetical protein
MARRLLILGAVGVLLVGKRPDTRLRLWRGVHDLRPGQLPTTVTPNYGGGSTIYTPGPSSSWGRDGSAAAERLSVMPRS